MIGDTFTWTNSSGGLSNTTAKNPYLLVNTTESYDITLSVKNLTGLYQVALNQLNNSYFSH